MKISWKQVKAEIDGLPKTEKTLLLKKRAEGFEKELQEQIKKQDELLRKVPKKMRSKHHEISIEEILGENKK